MKASRLLRAGTEPIQDQLLCPASFRRVPLGTQNSQMREMKNMDILDAFQLAPPDGNRTVAPAVDQFVQLGEDLPEGCFARRLPGTRQLGYPLLQGFSILRGQIRPIA